MTRTLAVGAGVDGAPWRWRVSVATIERDGPFSCYPGVDRISMLLAGTALQLVGSDPAATQQIGLHQCACYPGEAQLLAHVTGAPLQCLNVMTRRGLCQARLQLVAQPTRIQGESVMLVLKGAFSVSDSHQVYAINMPLAHAMYTQAATNYIVEPGLPNSLLAWVELLPANDPRHRASGAPGYAADP